PQSKLQAPQLWRSFLRFLQLRSEGVTVSHRPGFVTPHDWEQHSAPEAQIVPERLQETAAPVQKPPAQMPEQHSVGAPHDSGLRLRAPWRPQQAVTPGVRARSPADSQVQLVKLFAEQCPLVHTSLQDVMQRKVVGVPSPWTLLSQLPAGAGLGRQSV